MRHTKSSAKTVLLFMCGLFANHVCLNRVTSVQEAMEKSCQATKIKRLKQFCDAHFVRRDKVHIIGQNKTKRGEENRIKRSVTAGQLSLESDFILDFLQYHRIRSTTIIVHSSGRS